MSFIASLKIRMMQKKRKTRLNNVQEIAPQVKTFSQTFARCSVVIFISSFLQFLRREGKFVHIVPNPDDIFLISSGSTQGARACQAGEDQVQVEQVKEEELDRQCGEPGAEAKMGKGF